MDAVLRIVVEAGFIHREKPGLFSQGNLLYVCDFIKETWIATFFELNGKKSLSVAELEYEPALSYLNSMEINWNETKILVTEEDFANQVIITRLKN